MVTLLVGFAVLAVFAFLSVEDARALSVGRSLPMVAVLAATGGSVLAGMVHLALTPEHWRESHLYGAVFLVSAVLQLGLASLLTRPAQSPRLWVLLLVTNVTLAAVYVATRIVPPPGADTPEEVGSVGLATMAAELVVVVAAATIVRRLTRGATARGAVDQGTTRN